MSHWKNSKTSSTKRIHIATEDGNKASIYQCKWADAIHFSKRHLISIQLVLIKFFHIATEKFHYGYATTMDSIGIQIFAAGRRTAPALLATQSVRNSNVCWYYPWNPFTNQWSDATSRYLLEWFLQYFWGSSWLIVRVLVDCHALHLWF